jgi:ADP-ribose pyrophosphatase YjhB (NUDIX family)
MTISKYIRLGCSVLIMNDEKDKVILGVRNKDPGRGKIVTPGGKIEYMENYEETAHREMEEELGIKIKDIKQIGAYELINKDRGEHRVIIYCSATHKSGDIVPDTDKGESKFYSKAEIQELIKEGKIENPVLQVLKDTDWA